jgi:single-strand DNA-binding protein
VAVGHDLARGKGKFFRSRPSLGTSAVEGPEADGQVRGEAAELVPEDEVPASYGEGIPDEEEPTFLESPLDLPPGFDPIAAMAGLPALAESGQEPAEPGPGAPDEPAPVPDDASSLTGDSSGAGGELAIEVEGLGADANRRPRPRRPAKRQPVSA